MSNDIIKKDDLFQYSFYSDDKKLCVVLNVENIKRLFGADEILLEETEHK